MNLDSRLLRRVRDSRLALILTIALGIGAGVLTVLQAGFLSQVISRVFIDGDSLDQVTRALLILLGIIILRSGLVWGSEAAANNIAVRVKTDLRRALFEKLINLGPRYAHGERTGELTNTMVEGVEALDAYFSQYLPQLVLAALVPLVFLFFVFPLDLITGLILLLTAPLIPFFMVLIGNMAQAKTHQQWHVLSRMSAYFLDVVQGLTTLKRLGRSKAQVGEIARVSQDYRLTTMSVLRITFLSAFALEMVATLSTAVVAVEIGLRLLYGRMLFQEALFLLLLAPEFYLPLRMLGTRFHAGMGGAAAANRIFEILEDPAVDGGHKTGDVTVQQLVTSDQRPVYGDQLTAIGNIQFQNVHFKYGADRPVLNGVTFSIHEGQKVALVGPSGAGKSTIAFLLLRFIAASDGQIMANGQSLDEIEASDWRQAVAWVSQDPYLFYGTVADNIRLARPEASLEDMIQAAKLARAHEFIIRQPEGYETIVGERGVRLSAGQAQRIALARAFLKDAPLLILDEPTANLDPETEASIQGAIDELLIGRTALIIAHRLNTTLHADTILVLDEGQVVEHGTHQELSNRAGLYSRLTAAARGAQQPGASRPLAQDIAPGAVVPGAGLPESTGVVIPDAYASLVSQGATSKLDAGAYSAHANLAQSAYDGPSIARVSRFSTFRRLLNLVSPFKSQVALSVTLGFITIASGIGLMATSAYLISAAALQPSIAELQVAIVGVRFFGISRAVFRYLERLASHTVTLRLLANLRVWFYKSLEPLAPARLTSYRSGDLLSRIQYDIESLQNFYVRALSPPLVALLVALMMGVFLARFDRSLTLALLVFFTLVAVGLPMFIHQTSRAPGRRVVILRGALNIALVEGIQGMADLLAYGAEERHTRQVEVLSRQLGRAQKRFARIGGLQNSLGVLLANTCIWMILILAIPLVDSGAMSGVYLAVVVLAALASFEAVLPLPQAALFMESSLTAAERLHEVVDTEPEVQDPAQPMPIPDTLDLKVDSLSFHYPSPLSPIPFQESLKDPHNVLSDVSFHLSPGKSLAIVGPSGAGKSTLASILLRFWEYHHGRIVLGGDELKKYNSYELRDRIGMVAQDSTLFNATLRENLLIARPQASQDEVVKAARQARIHDFIESLPDGYSTFIGERGLRLSGGERQRLILARAFLKNAPLLLLDEATANLDAITERQVLHTIKKLTQDRSALIITHRLLGLDAVDEIIVLHEGAIVERGTHRGLLSRDGNYRRMWDLQHQELLEQ
jgi:ATP-binding cassette subfamily C protein CydCD